MTPLTQQPDYDDERPIICTHRAWLARRSAELRGREPEPVTSDAGFDGRKR